LGIRVANPIYSPAWAVAEIGSIAAQLTFAMLAVAIAVPLPVGRSLGDWLLFAFAWPVFVPVMGLYIWSQFYGFLVLPLLGAFAVSATATLAWIKLAADRWRTLWMSIAVFSFSATILALCQIQFHRDVVSAAKRLAPD